MANVGMWQGAAQGMRDLSATGMGILNFQQNREHQMALENEARARTLLDQDRLRMQEETFKLQNKALQIAAAEAEDKVKLISLPDRLTQMGIKNPEEQKVFMERFAPYIEEGVSGTPMVQKKHFEDVGKTLVTDPEFGVQYGTVRTKRLRAEINGLLSGEIKPEKGVEPQAQLDTLVKQLELAENKVAAYNRQIRAKNKEGIKNYWNPNTEAWETHNITDVPPGLIPEDVRKAEITAKAGAESKVPPHGTVVVKSADGKTEQRMQFNPASNRYDIPVGNPYPVTSQVINVNTAAQNAENFGTWTPEEKAQAFGYNLITGKPPENARGMRANDRQAYAKGYAKWQLEQGLRPRDIALIQSDYKAGDMSLKNMAKQEAPMRAFVNNINVQVDYAKKLFDGLQRTDVRLLNVPLRELKTRVIGSGLERQYELFLQEISMEANKLAQGSSASIAQIPEGNRKEWLRIHDINLPLKEILPVLEGTKAMANMRMSTWMSAKEEVRNQLRDIGVQGTPEPQGGQPIIIRYDAQGNRVQ